MLINIFLLIYLSHLVFGKANDFPSLNLVSSSPSDVSGTIQIRPCVGRWISLLLSLSPLFLRLNLFNFQIRSLHYSEQMLLLVENKVRICRTK